VISAERIFTADQANFGVRDLAYTERSECAAAFMGRGSARPIWRAAAAPDTHLCRAGVYTRRKRAWAASTACARPIARSPPYEVGSSLQFRASSFQNLTATVTKLEIEPNHSKQSTSQFSSRSKKRVSANCLPHPSPRPLTPRHCSMASGTLP